MRYYYVAIPRLPTPPRLDDPACTSQRDVFDEAIDGRNETAERQALTICRSCPSRQPCQDWYRKLPTGKRPLGVTAGFVYRPRTRKNPYDD